MRTMNRLLACVLCAALILLSPTTNPAISVLADDSSTEEQKIYSNATMEDAFADNYIMVVLNNEASLDYLQTEKIDFSEIKTARIESFTSPRGKDIKAMVDERKNASLMERLFTGDTNAEEISRYREVLCIELEERGKDKVLEAIALLEQREDVLYVGPDYAIKGCAVTDSNTVQNEHWEYTTINLPEAHEMLTGSETVRVAVLDTGIDASHPALAGKVNKNGNISKNYVEHEMNDANGNEIKAWTDLSGHGTHVAGIIAATAVNVELIFLRVLDSYSDGYSRYVMKAMKDIYALWGQNYMIPIINFSAGWGASKEYYYDESLKTVIEQYPGLFICGAGNNAKEVISSGNNNNTQEKFYPASHTFANEDRVIVVGASNQADNGLWMGTSGSGSNYGQSTVDIFAPGDTILSCYPSALCVNCFKEDGSLKNPNHVEVGYHKMSGTSMATPYVTGVAALIMSIHPSKSASEIKTLIINNDDNQSWLTDLCVSDGRLNAYKALYASHTFTAWEMYSASCKSRRCTECDYVEEVHLQPFTIQQNDATTHSVVYPCCNYTKEVSHSWLGWSNYNAL